MKNETVDAILTALVIIAAVTFIILWFGPT